MDARPNRNLRFGRPGGPVGMAFDRKSILSPAPNGLPLRAFDSQRTFQERASTNSLREKEEILDRMQRFLDDYADTQVTVDGQTVTVLARRGRTAGESNAVGTVPWQMDKMANRTVRIYPSAIWDGLGHSVWATWEGEASTAESYFDVPLEASPKKGFIYLECIVDDTDDYHGIIKSAKIDRGEEVAFNQRSSNKVNIALASYFITNGGEDFALDPIRAFSFVLRRYGPPGSITYDCEPL